MTATLNGANPAGRFGSVNDPARWVSRKDLSRTSILPPWKSARYRKFAPPVLPSATPLYTAPSAATNGAWADVAGPGGGTPGLQPSTHPVSDAVMNWAGALLPPAETTKSLVPLNTWPVGAPNGMLTTRLLRARGAPFTSPVYREDRPGPLSETQNAPVAGLRAMPHGLTRLGSVIGATPDWSE